MKKKIASLEKKVTLTDDETVWVIPHLYLKGTPKPVFPSEEEQIAEARTRGETRIVVTVAVEYP
ncbi:MAG: hypothetical protein ABSH25_18820 [Syntrophorhabdales bacterium]|jgi:hypothetical protein